MAFGNAKRTSSFEQCPAGNYAALLIQAVDLGTQQTTFGPKRQAMLTWEITKTMESGKPYIVSKFYSVSLHEKSTFRKDIQSWLGRPLTEAEVSDFHIEPMFEIPCLLNIQHVTGKDGDPRAKIVSISPLAEGMSAPERVNDILVLDLEAFDEEVFDALSEGVQKIVERSPEFKNLKQSDLPLTGISGIA